MLTFDSARSSFDVVRDTAAALRELLDADTLPHNGQRVRELLVDLAEVLDDFYRAEDMRMFPNLPRLSAGAAAGRFADGIGNIGSAVSNVFASWSAPGRIERDPDGFIGDARHLLDTAIARVVAADVLVAH